MEKKSRIILFQSCTPFKRLCAGRYEEAYVFSGDPRSVKLLPYDFLDWIDHYTSHYRAGQVIDWVYKEYITKDESGLLNEVMQDERSSLIIKKTILYALGYMFLNFILAEKFIERYKIDEPIDFIPDYFSSALYEMVKQKNGFLPHSDKVRIPSWYLRRLRFKEGIMNIFYRFALVLFPLVIAFQMKIGKPKKQDKSHFKYTMHLWDSAFHGLPTMPSFLDLLVDEVNLKHKDILYVIENKLSRESLKKMESSGYGYCYFKKMIKEINLWEYLNKIYSRIARKSLQLFLTGGGKMLLNESYAKSFIWEVLWEMFYLKYDIETFLTVQEAGNVARAIVQKRHGSNNLFIFLTAAFDPVYRENMNTHADSYYSFMLYDKMLTSKISIDYCKNNNNNFIGEYVDIGILRSDNAFRVKSNPDLRDKMKKELKIPQGSVVIGFLDNSIGRMAAFDEKEGIRIFSDIYRLLESNKDYYMVYKSRGSHKVLKGSQVLKEQNRLITHNRVFYVNNANLAYSAQHYMGICDLVIGVFASSITQESVSAGIRTICYVPSERFNKDVFMVRTFPRFCASGFAELKENAEYWLFKCSEEEFKAFQDKYIRKYVDTYCDGKASDRLNRILSADSPRSDMQSKDAIENCELVRR